VWLCLQAAVAIQRRWRGSWVRCYLSQQQSAALQIQRHWRGCLQYCRYKQLHSSVICIQARARQWQASRRFALMRGAAIYIQVILMSVRHKLRQGCLHALHVLSKHTTINSFASSMPHWLLYLCIHQAKAETLCLPLYRQGGRVCKHIGCTDSIRLPC